MADSWEDREDETEERVVFQPEPPKPPAPKMGLNPMAASFSFNPSASTFTPGAPKPAAPSPPTPQAPAEPVSQPETAPEPPASSPPPQPEAAETAEPAAETSAASASEAPAAAPEAPAPAVEEATAQVSRVAIEEDEEEDVVDESFRQQQWQEILKKDPKDHLNVVFIGHVDAGKSTLCGQVLYLMGAVDSRTIEKYEREAKDKKRETWYMAYIMDTNEEERAKGKTVEVGRAPFETDKRRYTILDAPGHKNFVPAMIQGASQADVGVLVIAARKGEFETGFERGGQTREHAQLAKTLGVTKLIVVINKMDDPSIVEEDGTWCKARYDEIESKITPFLKSCGYNVKRDVMWLPVSGLTGINIKTRVDPKLCPWYDGKALFEYMDGLEGPDSNPLAPFRMPIMDKFKDMGTMVMGKSERGFLLLNDKLVVLPDRKKVKVSAVYRNDEEQEFARPGENLRLRLEGIEDSEIMPGYMLSSVVNPCPVVTKFECQIKVLELLEHKPIFSEGYSAVLHLHACVEECEVIAILAEINPKTGAKKKVKFCKTGGLVLARIAVRALCCETFENAPQLGRFTLRDEGRTIGIGKITRLPK